MEINIEEKEYNECGGHGALVLMILIAFSDCSVIYFTMTRIVYT